VLAVLAALGCAIGAALLLAATTDAAVVRGGVLALVVGALLAVASGASAYGLWTLRWWAWPLAIVAWVSGGSRATFALANGTLDTGIVIAPIAIIYLLTPDIRAAFGTRVASPSRSFLAATVALALLPVALAVGGAAVARWRPTVPAEAGSTLVVRVDLSRVAAVTTPAAVSPDEATVVASDCLDRDQRPAGWLDLCWSVVRQPDADPAGDYYRFEATGTFGADATTAGESSGSGIRWLVLRNDLQTPIVDSVSSAEPDGVVDGCPPDDPALAPAYGPTAPELPCDGQTVGTATLQDHTVTWTCTGCLLDPGRQEQRIGMAEDVKVAEGVLPSWALHADFGD
jgi:hypothetical protein